MNVVTFWMAVLGTACWAVCFCWMHQISRKQNKLLDQLQHQAERIEKLSKEEHDLIREVHPQVAEIKDTVEQMASDNGGVSGK